MKSQQSTNAFVKEMFMDLKTQLETIAKNHQASIQNLETKFDRLVNKQSGRPSGSVPSNTQPNLKGHNSKAYQPPQSRNENVNVVFTRSGKSFKPPVNPNDQQNDSETPINFDSDDEEDEPTPQPKTQNPKPVKETLLPKPYKPKIPYPQRLRKEKMEAQYGHFKRNCPRLRNNDRGNQAGNDRAPVKVYVVGNAGANPDNVVAVWIGLVEVPSVIVCVPRRLFASPEEIKTHTSYTEMHYSTAPYRLDRLPEMKEISEQTERTADKGFIRPSSITWGARSC
ncbi:hypothetical protein Tco_1367978 [Tanacetum coccineum]